MPLSEPIGFIQKPDGQGNMVMHAVPISLIAQKRGKRPSVPDPIMANPEASAQRLASFIERLERLREERKGINDDIKDVMAEAKSVGFDRKGIDAILKLRAMETHDRQETEAIIETYRTALGIT